MSTSINHISYASNLLNQYKTILSLNYYSVDFSAVTPLTFILCNVSKKTVTSITSFYKSMPQTVAYIFSSLTKKKRIAINDYSIRYNVRSNFYFYYYK